MLSVALTVIIFSSCENVLTTFFLLGVEGLEPIPATMGFRRVKNTIKSCKNLFNIFKSVGFLDLIGNHLQRLSFNEAIAKLL